MSHSKSKKQAKVDELINLFWLSDTEDEQGILLKLKALNQKTLSIHLQDDTIAQLKDKYYYSRQMIKSKDPNKPNMSLNDFMNPRTYFEKAFGFDRELARLGVGLGLLLLGSVLIGLALSIVSAGSVPMILMMVTGISLILLSINPIRLALSEFYHFHKHAGDKAYQAYDNENDFKEALLANNQFNPNVVFSKKMAALIESNLFQHLDLSSCKLTKNNLECLYLIMKDSTAVRITLDDSDLPKADSPEAKEIQTYHEKINNESNLNALYMHSYAFFGLQKKGIFPDIQGLIFRVLQKLFLTGNESLASKLSRIQVMNSNFLRETTKSPLLESTTKEGSESEERPMQP